MLRRLRAYSSAASLVLKGHQRLTTLNTKIRQDFKTYYEASASWRRFTARRAEKSKYDPNSQASTNKLCNHEELLMESFEPFQEN